MELDPDAVVERLIQAAAQRLAFGADPIDDLREMGLTSEQAFLIVKAAEVKLRLGDLRKRRRR